MQSSYQFSLSHTDLSMLRYEAKHRNDPYASLLLSTLKCYHNIPSNDKRAVGDLFTSVVLKIRTNSKMDNNEIDALKAYEAVISHAKENTSEESITNIPLAYKGRDAMHAGINGHSPCTNTDTNIETPQLDLDSPVQSTLSRRGNISNISQNLSQGPISYQPVCKRGRDEVVETQSGMNEFESLSYVPCFPTTSSKVPLATTTHLSKELSNQTANAVEPGSKGTSLHDPSALRFDNCNFISAGRDVFNTTNHNSPLTRRPYTTFNIPFIFPRLCSYHAILPLPFKVFTNSAALY
ncbi:hypothetical protein EV368DRAFT_85836 [Lentinula lateritia]|nr:hypothetical protein EV368DRAFT_85836 [Lentinula lateritia]